MLSQSSSKLLAPTLSGLCLGTFALTCVYPGWASVAQMATVMGFTGFVLWLNPFRRQEIGREEFDKFKETVARLADDNRALRFKLFGQKT